MRLMRIQTLAIFIKIGFYGTNPESWEIFNLVVRRLNHSVTTGVSNNNNTNLVQVCFLAWHHRMSSPPPTNLQWRSFSTTSTNISHQRPPAFQSNYQMIYSLSKTLMWLHPTSWKNISTITAPSQRKMFSKFFKKLLNNSPLLRISTRILAT